MAEEKICSEITGTVWKIEMGVGDTVAEDDVITVSYTHLTLPTTPYV